MNFATLQDYLDWRATMRTEYATLSDTIRTTKRNMRSTMSQGGYAGDMQCSLIGLKHQASEMMEQRKLAKEAAVASWEAWQAAKAIAA